MKKTTKQILMICIIIIIFSGISILSSSCSTSNQNTQKEPVGLRKYNKKKSNTIRSNIKVRDASPRPNKKKKR